MARFSSLAIAAAWMLAAGSATAGTSASERILADPCARAGFVRLLHGTHPNAEMAAFIVEGEGALTFVVWPRLAWNGSQRWRGALPSRTIAVVHTHPLQVERPSLDDVKQATKLRIPFFVVTSRSISLVETQPELRVRKVAGYGWPDGLPRTPPGCGQAPGVASIHSPTAQR